MVGLKKIAYAGVAAAALALTACPSPFLARIQQEIAKYPFAATSYTFVRQWGNPHPEYAFGSAVVKVDTAGFVYVADSTFRIRKFNSAGVLQRTYDVASTTGISGSVYDMAFDAAGNMYVATSGSEKILKYDVSGNRLTWTPSSAITTAVGLAVETSSGSVYVLDSGQSKVLKFDPSGNLVTSWDGKGVGGTGPSLFSSPGGIAVDPSGYVYVADTYNNVIRKYYSSGTYSTTWTIVFNHPQGIAVDSSYTFYVADTGNSQIVKTTTGTSISAQWGSVGQGNGYFTSVRSVAVDSSGINVYTADVPYPSSLANGVGRIQKFNTSGGFATSWGGLNLNGNGELNTPGGVAVDSAGNVYVSDTGNSRIQKFDSTGAYLTQWGDSSVYGPWYGSIAVDSAGNVYAPDQTNHRIHVLDKNLVYQKSIGAATLQSPMGVALDAAGNIYVADYGLGKIMIFDSNGYTTHVPASIGGPGVADGLFEVPVGVAVDSAGNVYVSDFALFQPRTNMIQKFDTSGQFVKAWGTAGTGDGQFTLPVGIAVDKYDHVYVCDFANRRVQKFESDGTFLGTWGGVGVGNGSFAWPFNVVVNSSGHVLVSDATNNIVQEFAPVIQ